MMSAILDKGPSHNSLIDDLISSHEGLLQQIEEILHAFSHGTPDPKLASTLARRLVEDLNTSGSCINSPKSREELLNNLTHHAEHAAVTHIFRINRPLLTLYESYCRKDSWTSWFFRSLRYQMYQLYLIQSILLLGFPDHKRTVEIKRMLPVKMKKHPLVPRLENVILKQPIEDRGRNKTSSKPSERMR